MIRCYLLAVNANNGGGERNILLKTVFVQSRTWNWAGRVLHKVFPNMFLMVVDFHECSLLRIILNLYSNLLDTGSEANSAEVKVGFTRKNQTGNVDFLTWSSIWHEQFCIVYESTQPELWSIILKMSINVQNITY